MKEKMTIITAYYKIDLAKTSGQSYKAKRTTADYLAFFSFWAGLKNDIVIYTDLDIEDEIYAMRNARGGGKTQIIKKALSDLAPDDYEAIQGIFARFNQAQGRFDPTHPPHTSADYDYLMYCKSFFVCDYIRTNADNKAKNFLWLDFGYNFNGYYYTDSTQFDFELVPDSALKTTLSQDKIHLFSLGEIDSHTLPHILIHGTEHFLIGNVMGGGNAWLKFNAHLREALRAFLSFQIMDDDQKLYLWVARNYPQDCAIYAVDGWFGALFYVIPASIRESIKTKERSILQCETLNAVDLSGEVFAPKFLVESAPTPQDKTYLQVLRDEFRELKSQIRLVRKGIKRLIKAICGAR